MGDSTDMAQIRAAAHQREWNTLQDTLKRLLAQFDSLIALEIAAERVVGFLPRFEAYYPEAGWVRELLLTVVSYASAPNELPDHAVTQFPSPGCGNFVGAVLDLARAVQTGVSPFERYSFITNAIANAVLAELMDMYYSQHPDEWEYLNSNPDVSIRQELYGRFWLDADVAARDTAIWLDIADQITTKM
jgi:hypothetical protein